jgi:hypothetical protein
MVPIVAPAGQVVQRNALSTQRNGLVTDCLRSDEIRGLGDAIGCPMA